MERRSKEDGSSSGRQTNVLGDDRDACKAWVVENDQMHAGILRGLTDDLADWQPTRLSLPRARFLEWGRGMAGLPSWMRRFSPAAASIRLATLFPLVKTKCFEDTGVKRCMKEAHSCWSRVIDSAGFLLRNPGRLFLVHFGLW